VKLRTPLRTFDALVAYITTLPAESQATALVMGSHAAGSKTDRAGEERKYASQVTTDVATLSPIPCFIYRCGEHPPTPAGAQSRLVVLAVDGKMPTSRLVARWAAATVVSAEDEVRIVCKPVCEEEKKEAMEACRQVLLDAGIKAVSIDTERCSEDVRDALVEIASGAGGRAPDVMVLASRGPSFPKRQARPAYHRHRRKSNILRRCWAASRRTSCGTRRARWRWCPRRR